MPESRFQELRADSAMATIGRPAAASRSSTTWNQATIADLSAMAISRMPRSELARVVRSSRLPNVSARPEYLDRQTLERLTFLARLCSRNRRG